jgi:hypothetical protein
MEARQALQGSLGTRTGRIPRARSEVNPRMAGGGRNSWNGGRRKGGREGHKATAGSRSMKQEAGPRTQEPGWLYRRCLGNEGEPRR